MTTSRSRLVSNRVVTTTPGNVTLDRYQYLDLSSAEPNLGTSGNGNVLTTDIYGNRVWSNVLNIKTITVSGNTNTGNILSNGFFWANGTAFVSSSFGNANVISILSGSLGSNSISTAGNVTAGNVITSYGIFWANGTAFVSSSYGNSNVASFLSSGFGSNTITTTGNITSGNIIASTLITTVGNVKAGNLITTDGIFWSNGVSFVSSSYNNANVSSFLSVFGSNSITTTGNVTTGNIITNTLHVDTIIGNTSTVVAFTGTGAIGLPVGTSGNRPSGANGYLRYNTDIGSIEYFDGTAWITVTNSIVDQQITPDGINSTFTLTQSTTSVGIIVSLNGIIQSPGASYTVVGNQITFNEVPYATDIIDIRYLASAVVSNSDTNIVDTTNQIVTTSNTIIDSFNTTTIRSAKYTVSSTTTSDSHMAEVHITQFGATVVVSSYEILNTGSNSIQYYANLNGSTVNLLALGTVSSQVRVQKTYFNI